jgi:hypothetical protein
MNVQQNYTTFVARGVLPSSCLSSKVQSDKCEAKQSEKAEKREPTTLQPAKRPKTKVGRASVGSSSREDRVPGGTARPYARRNVSSVISGGTPIRTGKPNVPSPRFT